MNLTEFKELIQRKIEKKEVLKKNKKLLYEDWLCAYIECKYLKKVQKWLSEVK